MDMVKNGQLFYGQEWSSGQVALDGQEWSRCASWSRMVKWSSGFRRSRMVTVCLVVKNGHGVPGGQEWSSGQVVLDGQEWSRCAWWSRMVKWSIGFRWSRMVTVCLVVKNGQVVKWF
ncbi:hypothetical protein Tcan_18312 [Toxocara canis]|uniref:Uncharacterized protein n=1 Tax=Toxocara canis TaxID=6265 RepID=A0A0B2VTS3_TOXCA|nr:hypothetical protein Tcan_18312 [Toxocara canis]